MVESTPDSLYRTHTPTQDCPLLGRELESQDSRFGASFRPSSSPDFYDRGDVSTPTGISNGLLRHPSGGGDTLPDPLDVGAQRDMSERSAPRRANTGSHRPGSRSMPTNTHELSRLPTEQAHLRPTLNLRSSSIPPAPSHVSYAQTSSFFGQHANTAPVYGFSPYHNPMVTDSNAVSQTIHANYQPQAPASHAYSYQTQSHSAGMPNPMYHPHQIASSPISQDSAVTPIQRRPYGGSGSFHSLQYSPSLPTPPFSFPQSFTPSAMFQSQSTHPPFGPTYVQGGESDPRGPWYYFPQTPFSSGHLYEGGPAYHPHFSVPYPCLGHREIDTPYPNSAPAGSPVGRSFSQRPGVFSSPSSPRGSGAEAPLQSSAGNFVSGSSTPGPPTEKPISRRSYHPKPPANRSDWVMWAGNVPPDATYDELWGFFNQGFPGQSTDRINRGVLSVFLITRSNCAFINYESKEILHEAIARFNGMQLRPFDARCPRLVCRVRKLDDDLKAGVGGQRGTGMHSRWIKERKSKLPKVPSDPPDLSSSTSVSESMAAVISAISVSGDEPGDSENTPNGYVKPSRRSASYSSTNSSFLSRHFPKRYFILKSLTQHDLDLSLERGLWATQRHNEEVLDQAFRTSKEVYLIFGVNRSGEFYGYARMAGPVSGGEKPISWASRTPQSSNSNPGHSSPSVFASKDDTFLSPNDTRMVDNSPLSIDAFPRSGEGRIWHSTPALLGDKYDLPTIPTPEQKFSLDQGMHKAVAKRDFHLDAGAPQRAMKSEDPSLPRAVADEGEQQPNDEGEAQRSRGDEAWGDSFAVEWISTVRLPFQRTRQFRNPWNHDREVKVSRDGTELEPTVGERLLEEWERFAKETMTRVPSPKDDGRFACATDS